MYLKNRIIIFSYFFISFCLLFFPSIFLPFSSYQSISFCFSWFRFAFVGFVSFRFHFVDFVSFRFVSFRFVSFSLISFRFVSFSFYFVSHFIGTRKSPTCCQSLTNFITRCYIEYIWPEICTDCIGSYKSSYNKLTTTTAPIWQAIFSSLAFSIVL